MLRGTRCPLRSSLHAQCLTVTDDFTRGACLSIPCASRDRSTSAANAVRARLSTSACRKKTGECRYRGKFHAPKHRATGYSMSMVNFFPVPYRRGRARRQAVRGNKSGLAHCDRKLSHRVVRYAGSVGSRFVAGSLLPRQHPSRMRSGAPRRRRLAVRWDL